jgi:hypothetical protein
LLNNARIKFLGLNLDYGIDKAIRQLGYAPSTDFRDAMPVSMGPRDGTDPPICSFLDVRTRQD